MKNLTEFLNFIINPDSFLLVQNFEDSICKKDIRSSAGVRVVGKKIVHLFRTLFLMVADNLSIILSWLCIERTETNLNFRIFIDSNNSYELNSSKFLAIMVILNLAIFISSGLYSTKDKSRRIRDASSACSLSYLVYSLSFYVFKGSVINESFLFINLTLFWLFSLLLICLERFLIFEGIKYARSAFSPFRRKFILIGDTEDVQESRGFFEDSKSFKLTEVINLDFFDNNADSLLDILSKKFAEKKVDEVIICSWEKIEEKTKLYWVLQSSGISWRILPIKGVIPQHEPELATIDGVPTIRYRTPTIVGIDFLLKRTFDLVVAGLLLVVLAIPMLVISLAVKLDSPGSVFYKQSRIGLKGKKFEVWKFRTMVENASQLQELLEEKNEVSGGILFKISNDPRITKIGNFLRRYSLDELPQLFNVLMGEMSLVGPRPLPIRDVEKFESHHHFRHEILPGITGLWQVSGRSDTNSEKVFKLDFQYIQDWSLALDMKVLFKTVQVVLSSKGAY